MARSFSGTDRVVSTYSAHPVARTVAIWAYRTGDGGGSGDFMGRMMSTAGEDGTNFVEVLCNGSTGYFYSRSWSSADLARWRMNRPATNEWHHVCVTYDGSSTANDPVMYLDGASQTVTEVVTPSGTLDTAASAVWLGNRGPSGNRNWGGALAEWAIWERVLTASEVQSVYAHGPLAVPDWVRYQPMWGDQSPEPGFAQGAGASGAVTGTTRAVHPPIAPFSPIRRGGAIWEQVVVGGFEPAWARGANRLVGGGIAVGG